MRATTKGDGVPSDMWKNAPGLEDCRRVCVYRNVTIVEEGEVRETTSLKKQGQMEDCSTAPTVPTLRTLAPPTVA